MLCLVLTLGAPGHAKPPVDNIRIFTTWDPNFFYAAFKVPDSDLEATHKVPNATVGDDDAVGVYFQTDRDKSSTIGPHSFRMLVSAAGGADFEIGDAGKWKLKKIYDFKYAVTPSGTLNYDQDDDSGYEVELAIPWGDLGVTPDIGTGLGFNAVVQMKGEHTGFVSLATGVTTAADEDNPSKWVELWLRGPVQPLLIHEVDRVFCDRSLSRAPVVDGHIYPGEYSDKTSITLEKPPLTTATHIVRDVPLDNLVFAMYTLDPQLSDEAVAKGFVNYPYGGIGPWDTPGQVGWQRSQLSDAHRAGIDVILPICHVEAQGLDFRDAMRLQALVGALREMTNADEDHPFVAACLDIDTSVAHSQPLSASQLWQALHDVYTRIPPTYWAQVRLPESRSGSAALPVFVRGHLVLSAKDRDTIDAQALETLGARIVWIADTRDAGAAPAADGYLPQALHSEGAAFDGKGWIKVASITPGYARPGEILGRASGQTYVHDWDAVVQKDPTWVVVDSFNDWSSGSEIAASSEYGLLYVDATAIQSSRYNGRRDYAAKYIAASVPPVISPKFLSLARIDVRNVGTRPWLATSGIQLGYRWYQHGHLYSRGLVAVPMQEDVPFNGTAHLAVGVIAVDSDQDPLPAGDWLLVFDLMTSGGKYFSSLGSNPLAVPVKVGVPPAVAYSVRDLSLPPIIEAGQPYLAKVTIRNNGTSTWLAAGHLSLVLTASSSADNGSAGPVIQTWAVPLPANVDPGRIAEIPVVVKLPPSAAAPAGSAKSLVDVKVALAQDGQVLAGQLGRPAVFSTLMSSADWGVSLTPPEKPVTGQQFGVVTKFPMLVANKGPRPWPGRAVLVARLFSLDGKLLVANAGIAKFRKGINPGESLTLDAEMVSPPYPGQYVVQWSVDFGNTDTANAPLGGRSDAVFNQYITVNGPALEFANLKALADTDVISSEGQPSEGNFDGSGASLPSDLVPPLVVPNPSPSSLCPVGLFGDDPAGGPSYAGVPSWRWISFLWPDKSDGVKNAVTAKGQTVAVTALNCTRVHVLAAAAGGRKQATFGLVYASGEQKVAAEVGDWSARAPGDLVAFRAAYHMTPEGPKSKPVYLYDVVLKADSAQSLTAIRLPDNPAIKVLAITLERPLDQILAPRKK